jgi:hypothetical protein
VAHAGGAEHTARYDINQHSVLTRSTLPSCKYEDGSGGARPCSWDVHKHDGNGVGLAYIVHKDLSVHYVWLWQKPYGSEWRWVGDKWAKRLGGHRDWSRCVIRVADTTRVRCPDGHHWVS